MTNEEFTNYLNNKHKKTSSFYCGITMFFTDIVVLILCLAIGFFIINLFAINNINFKSFINYSIFIPFILLLFAFNNLYPGIMLSPSVEVKGVAYSTFVSFVIIFVTIVFSDVSQLNFTKAITKESDKLQIGLALLVALFFVIILVPGCRAFAKRLFCKYNWWGVPVVVYCTGTSANEVIDKLLENKNLGYSPVAIIDFNSIGYNDTYYKDIPIFSPNNKDIIETIHKFNIKNALLCDYRGDISQVMNTYRYTISVAKMQTSFTCNQQLKDIAGTIGFASIHNLTFKSNLFIKRLIDIFIILFFTPLLIPVFLILSLMVKFTSKGPVFYGHKRIGKNGKEFKCWKFRSMYSDSQERLKEILATDPVRAAEWEAERKFKDDPRITKIGKFLRKTSLDELPQLFNVFIGQMSLVGPRPVTADEIEKYGDHKDYVLSVLPGLSGMWQISGRSDANYDERIYFDSFYIQNWSVWLDIWILIKTVWVVISGKGAY